MAAKIICPFYGMGKFVRISHPAAPWKGSFGPRKAGAPKRGGVLLNKKFSASASSFSRRPASILGDELHTGLLERSHESITGLRLPPTSPWKTKEGAILDPTDLAKLRGIPQVVWEHVGPDDDYDDLMWDMDLRQPKEGYTHLFRSTPDEHRQRRLHEALAAADAHKVKAVSASLA